MRPKAIVGVLVGIVTLLGGGLVKGDEYGGPSLRPAAAQEAKPDVAQGVTMKPLVTSLGPFRQVSTVPIVLSGQVVEIAPGGQTGREQFLVPFYIYVLEGVLTTDTQGGPIGINGIQYTAAGQSYSAPPGLWQNAMNRGTTPVRYLLLFVSRPGEQTVEKPKAD